MSGCQRMTRRRFLHGIGVVGTGALFPQLVGPEVFGKPGQPGANEQVIIGSIATGNRARNLMDHMPPGGRIVAISDVYVQRMNEAKEGRNPDWRMYQDYREMLDKEKLDAVVVATPDHARVRVCIHACQAGLDVYAEKPLTLTIAEGRKLVEAARRYKRVFQVGSQQRTMEMNRFACEFVRDGGLGKLRLVHGFNYPPPRRYQGLPEEPIPEGDNWDAWQAQAPGRPYNGQLQFGWMQWRSYSGGEMTNWGAHGVDQIQWALGMDGSGPEELWLLEDGPSGAVGMRYLNGVEVRFDLGQGPLGGAIFVGADNQIVIDRNMFETDPPDLVSNPPSPAVAEEWEGPGWVARPHLQNWLDCIHTRAVPNADVEIGHRSISVCHLANIVRELGRRLRWDPVRERFIDDPEADLLLDRPKRKGYETPEIG